MRYIVGTSSVLSTRYYLPSREDSTPDYSGIGAARARALRANRSTEIYPLAPRYVELLSSRGSRSAFDRKRRIRIIKTAYKLQRTFISLSLDSSMRDRASFESLCACEREKENLCERISRVSRMFRLVT